MLLRNAGGEMSRHTLIPHNPNYEVIVGWDKGLGDFFIQVFDMEEGEKKNDDVLVRSLGCNPLQEQLSFTRFVEEARKYGHLTDKLAQEILQEMQGKRDTNISKDHRD